MLINAITNFFLNNPNVKIVFFKSIIGPRSKKPTIEGSPKLFTNLLATKASASEHKDNKKESNNIRAIFTIGLKEKVLSIFSFITTLKRLDTNAPMITYILIFKNSFEELQIKSVNFSILDV